MFHPMALTVVIALAGAMLLSITFIPAAVALFMGDKVAEKENRIMGWARQAYSPVLAPVMAAPPAGVESARAAGSPRPSRSRPPSQSVPPSSSRRAFGRYT